MFFPADRIKCNVAAGPVVVLVSISESLMACAAGLALLVRKGQPLDDQVLFLQPFDTVLWITLLGVVFAAALVQKLLSLYTPYGGM
jgi:hypothetical protein